MVVAMETVTTWRPTGKEDFSRCHLLWRYDAIIIENFVIFRWSDNSNSKFITVDYTQNWIMDREKLKRIINESDLPEGFSSRVHRLATASPNHRKELIRGDPSNEETRGSAAIEIQRAWRGYYVRCHLFDFLQPGVSGVALYSGSKHVMQRLDDVRTPSPKSARKSPMPSPIARGKLDIKYDYYVEEMEAQQLHVMSFEEFCSQMIQDWWRSKYHGYEYEVSAAPQDVAVNQGTRKQVSTRSNKTASRSSKSRSSGQRVQIKPAKKKREGPPSQVEAAVSIQRAWRRHIDIQVFRYYRDLINFNNRGDPAMMLRCINPVEAKMLDAASGVHVKFRLAGDRFPPNIYYKIFTHRPVQDLCANSPKDYTRAAAKMRMGRDVHNKGRAVPTPADRGGWYQRAENNGWRLVSDRLITHAMSDPITWETSNRKTTFHHNKLQRRQDIEHKKKKRKLEWMKKLYKEGMLRAKTDDHDTIELIEGATAGMVATVDKLGVNAVQDWEVDELLHWTTSLNFDDYLDSWGKAATSAASEKIVYERLNLVAGTDPYEFTISPSTSHMEHESNRLSRNTPVSNQSPTTYSY